MTVRLSAVFEEHIRGILASFRRKSIPGNDAVYVNQKLFQLLWIVFFSGILLGLSCRQSDDHLQMFDFLFVTLIPK